MALLLLSVAVARATAAAASVVFADIIMIVFVMVAIGRCCAGLVRRRTWLGLAGVILVVAAIMAAYGLNSAFGTSLLSAQYSLVAPLSYTYHTRRKEKNRRPIVGRPCLEPRPPSFSVHSTCVLVYPSRTLQRVIQAK